MLQGEALSQSSVVLAAGTPPRSLPHGREGVVRQFALQFPQHCDRLVLVATGGLGR
jgi:hypothetical protein